MKHWRHQENDSRDIRLVGPGVPRCKLVGPVWVRSKGAVDEARGIAMKKVPGGNWRKRMNTLASDPRIPLESHDPLRGEGVVRGGEGGFVAAQISS